VCVCVCFLSRMYMIALSTPWSALVSIMILFIQFIQFIQFIYSFPFPSPSSSSGTRKSMWTNFAQICQVMHRQQTHTQSFVLAELGTEGSLDGTQRLVLRGRYAPKHIESLLKKYIIEYVTCHMCKNPETTLTRDSLTRLYFIQCESCGSRRSVAPIKTGYHATNRADRRAAKNAIK
jgi:translation initiation factor 2 subunit 2